MVDFTTRWNIESWQAETQKKWTETQRKAWIKKQRSRLSSAVAKAIEDGGATERKKSKTETAYFILRKEQMQYSVFKKAGWLIGSGAVESAMRRIVNLRLKGRTSPPPPGFWRKHDVSIKGIEYTCVPEQRCVTSVLQEHRPCLSRLSALSAPARPIPVRLRERRSPQRLLYRRIRSLAYRQEAYVVHYAEYCAARGCRKYFRLATG